MKTWLKDEKTGIECGINFDGDLFMGDHESGSTLRDTPENRKTIINEFCSCTGRPMPVISAAGSPIEFDGDMVEYSK